MTSTPDTLTGRLDEPQAAHPLEASDEARRNRTGRMLMADAASAQPMVPVQTYRVS